MRTPVGTPAERTNVTVTDMPALIPDQLHSTVTTPTDATHQLTTALSGHSGQA